MCGEGLPRRGRGAAASSCHRPLALKLLLEVRVLGRREGMAEERCKAWCQTGVGVVRLSLRVAGGDCRGGMRA